MKFKAYQNRLEDGKVVGELKDLTLTNLSEGEVIVKVYYSSINYKDALGATGRGKVFRRLPIVGGIDLAGIVHASESKEFSEGDSVLATGCDIGEKFDGGYAEYARVKKESLVSLPQGLTLRESMILGTAGFTAALCIHRFEQNNQHPNLGPIVVTGASGGVGSFATNMLSMLGYEVIAVSSKKDSVDYLKSLGASTVLSVEGLKLNTRPLDKIRFGGLLDNLGGATLSKLSAHVNLWGNIACVGLAQSHELNEMTVMPLILRGVSLLGISSNNCPNALRKELWQKIATQWKPNNLNEIISEVVSLDQLSSAFNKVLDRKIMGRILVEIA